ncbi:MAG: three-Cys-motif partner protein TcmP [Crocosphaera sp.]
MVFVEEEFIKILIHLIYGTVLLIRLIKAVREGYKKSERKHPLNVKFIFIDNKKSHLDCLKNYAMPNAGLEELVNGKEHIFKSDLGELTEQCEFIPGDFESQINYCILKSEKRKGHSLFFLDPFGWSDVSMESIRKINNLKKSEIIYTFMIDYIKRFVFSKNGKERELFEKILETKGYFDIKYLKSLDTF